MGAIELIATIFGLACVWLCVRRSIWNWPVGLVQVILYAWVFFQARLYADVGLHIVYVVLQVYGWYHWTHGKTESAEELSITRWGRSSVAGCLYGSIVVILALGWLLHRYTNASLPYWDAAIAVLSLLAQYLLARKVLESWLVWIAVDVLAIGLYATKGLYITTRLYAVFLGMATAGWLAWRASLRGSFAADALSSLGSFSRHTAGTSSSSTSPVTTAATCTILVCTLDREPILGHLRYEWVRAMAAFENVRILHIYDNNLPQAPEEHPDF